MDALITVIAPVFGIILTGYLAGYFQVLGADSAAALNKFVYFFALPPVLFVFTARAPIDKVLNWPFIGAVLGGSALTLLICVIAGRAWFRHDLPALGVQGLTSVFANTAYMGVPLLLTVFGPDGALPAIVATLSANTLLIGGAIAALETSRATGRTPGGVLAHVSKTLVRSPLLIAPFLGIAFSYFALPIPKPIGNYLDLLSASAGPTALFAMGLSLVGQQLRGDLHEVFWLVILKLIVHPVLTYVLATRVFSMEPLWWQAAVLLAALPIGATVYVIAQQYDVFVQRASTTIVVSTALSIATISLFVIWFR